MASLRFMLDCRGNSPRVERPICLCVAHNGKSALHRTGIAVDPKCWDKRSQRVVKSPLASSYNMALNRMMLDYSERLLALRSSGRLGGMSAINLRDALVRGNDIDLYERLGEKRLSARSESRRSTFASVEHWCRLYMKGERICLGDITPSWVDGLCDFILSGGVKNSSCCCYLMCLHSVFVDAIRKDEIERDPFRRFRYPKIMPTRKRSLSAEVLRELFLRELPKESHRFAVDMFKLSFMLIGMNTIDMYKARKSWVVDGRLEYRRSKTGRLYSVKLEPEAVEIIGRWAGDGDALLCVDRIYRKSTTFSVCCSIKLSAILGEAGVTMYWARHSWATIASGLGIPRDVIAHGLGHGLNTVTDIYIDFDRCKVDEANRRVLDCVLYGKG